MRTPSILIVIDDITLSGGTERVATFIANSLSIEGKKITLLSITAKNSEPYYRLDDRVSLEVVGSNNLLALKRSMDSKKYSFIISISMGRLSFKVALIHFISRLKSKLILSEHVAFEASTWLISKLKLLSYQMADELVLLTEHDHERLCEKIKPRVSVIRNASSFSIANQSVLETKEKTILAVGRLTYQKAFDRIINIWATIENKKGWKLKIIGDGEDKESIEYLIEINDLQDSVELLPSSKNIDIEYEKASVFVMTSRYEGLPLVLIESKSFGIPAISYDCKTGPREIINNNSDGFLIPENNIGMFKDKLETLITDENLRKKMQLAALNDANNYTRETIIAKWLRILE